MKLEKLHCVAFKLENARFRRELSQAWTQASGPLRVLHSLKYTLLPPLAPNIGIKRNGNLKVLKIKGEFCSAYNISCL